MSKTEKPQSWRAVIEISPSALSSSGDIIGKRSAAGW
jgi:hypothetical protein